MPDFTYTQLQDSFLAQKWDGDGNTDFHTGA